MTAVAMDTYKIVKRLTQAGFTDSQAETVTDILRESRDLDLSHLATRADIAESRAAVEHRIDISIAGVKSELHASIADVKSELHASIAGVKSELHASIAGVKSELQDAIAASKIETIKWVVGIGFAQVAMILAVLRLFPGGHP